MRTGWSERVREVAEQEYVAPVRGSKGEVRIRVGDIQKKLKAQGFPAGYTNQILTSLESELFWKPRGLEMRTPIGQPRKHETVLTYQFIEKSGAHSDQPKDDPLLELAGILKGAIREGASAFLRELRRDKAA